MSRIESDALIAAMNDDTKTAWSNYRAALRDLPANTADPTDPTWPTKPG